ncbi:MAG TPA: hypothetical protein VG711_08185, partial [Phycisphaerales bacterium]|nr:hypothetical protein [Phycisphaerales bacterium]
MWFIIGFILVIAVPGCIYAVIALMEVPGLAEQRFGNRPGLPQRLNEWTPDVDSSDALAARD